MFRDFKFQNLAILPFSVTVIVSFRRLETSGNFRQLSETFGNFQKLSETSGNFWKLTETFKASETLKVSETWIIGKLQKL